MRYLFLICILQYNTLIQAQTLTGRVIGISDGDSFWLLTKDKQQINIRLHGIDAPEYNQPYSKVAKQFVSGLIFKKMVSVQQTAKDEKYDRIVGIVTVDGVNVNEALLKAGLVWHYKQYDHNPTWAKLEAESRRQRVGLWADTAPVAPWDWRHRGR